MSTCLEIATWTVKKNTVCISLSSPSLSLILSLCLLRTFYLFLSGTLLPCASSVWMTAWLTKDRESTVPNPPSVCVRVPLWPCLASTVITRVKCDVLLNHAIYRDGLRVTMVTVKEYNALTLQWQTGLKSMQQAKWACWRDSGHPCWRPQYQLICPQQYWKAGNKTARLWLGVVWLLSSRGKPD